MQDVLRIIIPIVAIHVAVLVAVLFVIRRLLLSDTMRAVERINQVEADVRKKEETLRREIEEREKEIARRKAEAEEDLQRQKEKIAKEMAQLKETMTADARREGDRILDQARRNEEKLRQQLLLEMEQKAADYGGRVVGLVFSEKVTAGLDQQFIDELLDALEEMDASTITVDASAAEFVCAHPLPEAQKQRLQKLLANKFGMTAGIAEQVRPELLAGLIMKMGSLEIDGSLLNRFREAAEEIKKNASA